MNVVWQACACTSLCSPYVLLAATSMAMRSQGRRRRTSFFHDAVCLSGSAKYSVPCVIDFMFPIDRIYSSAETLLLFTGIPVLTRGPSHQSNPNPPLTAPLHAIAPRGHPDCRRIVNKQRANFGSAAQRLRFLHRLKNPP